MITEKLYSFLDHANFYFSEHLFDNQLKDCIITLSRKKGCGGYHWWEKFKNRETQELISEIALNPDYFNDATVMESLAILAHEQVHLLQHVLDIAPRKGYHDKGFSRMMYDIGLQTSSTGEPNGKSVGQKISHYILQGGKFEIVCQAFLLKEKEHGFLWDSLVIEIEKKEKKRTREKFVCPNCMESAQAKKTAKLICGNDMTPMIIEGEDVEIIDELL